MRHLSDLRCLLAKEVVSVATNSFTRDRGPYDLLVKANNIGRQTTTTRPRCRQKQVGQTKGQLEVMA